MNARPWTMRPDRQSALGCLASFILLREGILENFSGDTAILIVIAAVIAATVIVAVLYNVVFKS